MAKEERKVIVGGKKYRITRDALGHEMVGIDRGKQSYPGYRNMSGSSRYNARTSRIFEEAKENKSDPVMKSQMRHSRKESIKKALNKFKK